MLYTPTTTEIAKMTRLDLVFLLASHVTPSVYQTAIKLPTEGLRALYAYYKGENVTLFMPRKSLSVALKGVVGYKPLPQMNSTSLFFVKVESIKS